MSGLTIDVVSDVVCPWCYLGKRRLEAALEKIGETEAIVRWRPYQLDETIPEEGLDREAYMRKKFGDTSRLAGVHDRLVAFGKEVDAAYDFEAIKRAPNTMKAHRLTRFAEEQGVGDKMVEALFRAYFEQGKDVGDLDTLVAIAQGCGMDGDEVRRRLDSDEGADATREEIDAWRRAGVTGVPFFVFEGKLAVSGAQSVEVLMSAMVEARAKAAG